MAIKVIINGAEETLEGATTILKLLEDKHITPGHVAVEVDSVVVDQGDYSSSVLKDGDRVEILYYMGGGLK